MNEFRFNVNDNVEQGWPSGGIPPEAILTGSRPVLARFSPAEAARIESFAQRHNIQVTQVARIALAVQYAAAIRTGNSYVPA